MLTLIPTGWTVFKSFIKWSIIFWGALFLRNTIKQIPRAHGGGLNNGLAKNKQASIC